MKIFNRKLIRPAIFTAVFAVLAAVVFLIAKPVLAQNIVSQAVTASRTGIGDIIRIMVGSLIYIYTYFVGRLLLVLISILVKVASYNDFVNSAVVIQGWTIIRDIANMFFIIILLAIAFGTILGVDKLDWKQRLPKLLIFAVLINFTRVIAGIVIDFGQVIMITFVNGFRDAAGGNFAELLGIRGMLELSVPGGNLQQNINIAQGNVEGAAIDFIQVIAAMIGGAIFATISLIVILMMLLVLIYRMVMLWIYVTLSPIAFLLGAFPQGEKYYADWWNKLISAVALGPVLAFFIWLSLATVASINVGSDYRVTSTTTSNQPPPPLSCGASELCQEDNILKFIVGIGMLMGGLTVAQGFANSAGEGMGGLVGWAKKSSTGAMKRLSGVGSVQKAKQAFQKKDMQAGGLGGLLARGAIYAQAGFKNVPLLGGAKAGVAVEKYQAEQIALREKKMGSLRDQELLDIARSEGGASYEKAAAMAILAKRGAINEKNFTKEDIANAKNVFGNAKSDLGQFMAAVKKQAPAFAYDLKKPEDREQFTLDVRRGVARAENLEAKYFEGEEGKDFVKGLSVGQTSEQIQAFYNKLTKDAQDKFETQLRAVGTESGASYDVKEALANITLEPDLAFANDPEGAIKWAERRKRKRIYTKEDADKFRERAEAGRPYGFVPTEDDMDRARAAEAIGRALSSAAETKGGGTARGRGGVGGGYTVASVEGAVIEGTPQAEAAAKARAESSERVAAETMSERQKAREDYQKREVQKVYDEYKAQDNPAKVELDIAELKETLEKITNREVQGPAMAVEMKLENLEQVKAMFDAERGELEKALREKQEQAKSASLADKEKLAVEMGNINKQLEKYKPKKA